MKIGMKEEMSIADKMTTSVSGLRAVHAFVREVCKSTHFHGFGGKVAARIVRGS